MPVSIRLRREGAKNRPYYKVVVADSCSPRDGKFIEIIGTYDPKISGHNSSLNVERAEYWIGKGAQPSDTVRSLKRKTKKGQQQPSRRHNRSQSPRNRPGTKLYLRRLRLNRKADTHPLACAGAVECAVLSADPEMQSAEDSGRYSIYRL